MSTSTDIDAHADAEAYCRLLALAVEHATEAMMITDAQIEPSGPHIVFANRALCRLSGYTANELLGATPSMFQGPRAEQESFKRVREALTLGQPLQAELVNQRKDGSEYVVEFRINPLTDPEGVVTHWFATMRDVTEQRREQEIQWLQQKLESLGALSGGIAHDFNNLLAVILGNVSLALLDLPQESPTRTMLVEIENATRRATELVRQLLTYAGKGRFVTQPLDLNDLVRDMRPEIESLLGTQVELRFDLARGAPAILADPIQIRQVLLNLVDNAVEAIGDRPGTLTIKTRICTLTVDELAHYQLGGELPAGEYIELTVADTGRGISPGTQARMFDPFFSTKVAGRGLGLATVLGVVQGHNGALRVSSSPGQGTHLIMLLPSSPIPAISPAGEVVSPGLVPLYGTVLVVDDEEAVRTTAARILERLGYEVLTANDGMMGVEVFQKHIDTITCILLDLTMPRMNGVEAVAAIRQIKPDARIVLMSGYNEHDITSRFGGLGVSGFLQKPFTPNQLHTRIQQACAV